MYKYLFVAAAVLVLAVGCNKVAENSTEVKTPAKNINQSFTPPQANTRPVQLAWRDVAYGEFKNLTDWQLRDEVLDWELVDLDKTKLKDFSSGKIFIFSKVFNQTPMGEKEMQVAEMRQKQLVDSVKATLQVDGWTLTASPSEGGFYQDFLYTKLGHPLVLQIGSRSAVTGGMYVKVEFLY